MYQGLLKKARTGVDEPTREVPVEPPRTHAPTAPMPELPTRQMTARLAPRMPKTAASTLGRGCRRVTRSVGHVILVAAALLCVPVAMTGPASSAQTSEEEATRAALEIQAARERANEAASAFFQAQSDLEVLEAEAESLARETDDLERQVAALRRDVEAIAMARFATSGASGIPLLTGLQPPKDQVQAEVLGGVVNDSGKSALDEFDFAEKQLAAKRSELAAHRRSVEAQRDLFAELQTEAEAEVDRLRRIEEQRLTDEAVQRALQAQYAADLAKLQEAMLANAAAAAKARPNPGVLAAQAAAAADAASDDTDVAADSDVGSAAADDPTLAVPTLAPNTGASGGTSGGRTGTGGPGSTPMGVLNGEVYLDNILCPISGAAYGDSWGSPRSGGRRHEGVDMLAPAGTPIYAVVGGMVTFKQNRLGGNAISLVGDNGNRYYYAHLSSFEGVNRRVEQGEVIGYNGDTGNATGVPHLHFEIHPGGGLAVNPYPSVRLAAC